MANLKSEPFEVKRLKKESNVEYWKRMITLGIQILLVLILELFRSLVNLFKKTEPKSINGQVALVTGGGNGLGQAICIELAKRGCNVAVCDINLPSAVETAKSLESQYGIKSKAYKVDVGKHEEVLELKNLIEKDLGIVDLLINNAGLTPTKSIEETSFEDLRKIVDVNLLSNIWTVKVFIGEMKKRRKGHIVQISSLAGLSGVPISSTYSATKFGVRGFMDSIAIDLVTEDLEDCIQTTTVYPYFIATNESLVQFLGKNDNLYFLPAFTASYMAKKTVDEFLKNKEHVVIPSFMGFLTSSTGMYPRNVRIFIQKKIYDAVRQVKLRKMKNTTES